MVKRNYRAAGLCGIAGIFLFAMLLMLTSCRSDQNQTMPGWIIEESVQDDSDLQWAYENGYFYQTPPSAKAEGIKLTLWGLIADPVRTSFIYSVEGEEVNNYFACITKIDGKSGVDPDATGGIFEAIYPADGKVVGAYIDALPDGEHVLTVGLYSPQDKDTILAEITVTANKAAVGNYYQSYDLNYKITHADAEMLIDRIIYSPTKAIIFFQLTNFELISKDYIAQPPHLLTADDITVVSTGAHSDSGPAIYRMFRRPVEVKDLKLVIPALSYRQNIAVDFTPEDLNQEKELLGTTLTMTDWRVTADWLEVDIQFTDAEELVEISIAGDRGYDHRENPKLGDKEYLRTFTMPLQQEEAPSKVTATAAYVPVIGDWVFSLPDMDTAYTSMQAAFAAVEKLSEEEILFESGIFIYDSRQSYETSRPSYFIVTSSTELNNGMVTLTPYTVGEEIIAGESTEMPRTEEIIAELKRSVLLENYMDRTSEVVNMAIEQGRNLAEEAFSLGYSLRSFYNGEWFLIVFDDDYVQAGYNIETGELVVADDIQGMSIENGRPVK